MRTKRLCLLICLIFILLNNQLQTANAGNNNFEQELIVKFYGKESQKIKVPQSKSLEEVMWGYTKDPRVEYVHPNYIYSTTLVPNDVAYNKQWYLQNISAEAAWDISLGSKEVLVAVIDSGVDLEHPDLKSNLVAGWNFVQNNGIPYDENGHGTHVTGIIGAVMNNQIGITGLAPRVKVMPIKVIGKNGLGDDYTIAKGIRHAVDKGAKIVNLSLGSKESSKNLEEAVNYAYGKGALVIAAAGNDYGKPVLYPAKYSNAIAVSATDFNNNLASFSNYGPEIEVSAPGEGIYSTWWGNGSGYAYLDGTSASTPMVSALAALIWSKSPYLYNFQVREIIQKGTDDLGETGKDNKFGEGKINIFKALNLPTYKTFLDIQGHWAQKNIETLATIGIVKGYSNLDQFVPEQNITRAEFATVLVRALGLEESDATISQFRDVKSSDWHLKYVETAADMGIVTGYQDGTFRPNQQVTREQMAAMVVRALEVVDVSYELTEQETEQILSQFSDNKSIQNWARSEMARAIDLGIVNGISASKLSPGTSATRAQGATMLKKMMDTAYLF